MALRESSERKTVRRACELAGVPPIPPNTLGRHFFGTMVIEDGGDIAGLGPYQNPSLGMGTKRLGLAGWHVLQKSDDLLLCFDEWLDVSLAALVGAPDGDVADESLRRLVSHDMTLNAQGLAHWQAMRVRLNE